MDGKRIRCLQIISLHVPITVWTVVQTVLTATFNSYGDRQISTPTKSIPLNRSTKKFSTIDYVREGTSYTKLGRNQSTGGFWAHGWNITKTIFIYLYPFYFDQRTGQTRGWIFTHNSSKDVKSRKDVPSRGLSYVPSNSGGLIPKNWNFGGVNRTFKAEQQKFQILTTWKLLGRSWRNFYMEYAPWMRLRGWSHGSPNQIQDGGSRHLEFRKNVNNSGLNKDIRTKLYVKMLHGHAEMTTWWKDKTGS